MPCDHPTGDGPAVALNLPSRQVEFLRSTFDGLVEGIESDLANKVAPDAPERPRNEREAATYRRLMEGLDGGSIVPDAEAVRLIVVMAEANDAENDYPQVVLEHRALCGLLAALEEGEA